MLVNKKFIWEKVHYKVSEVTSPSKVVRATWYGDIEKRLLTLTLTPYVQQKSFGSTPAAVSFPDASLGRSSTSLELHILSVHLAGTIVGTLRTTYWRISRGIFLPVTANEFNNKGRSPPIELSHNRKMFDCATMLIL
ncbi:unnamed protein product [Allacma fusca]|uniref:Uncharacterized protein n=1 Tax=Allacma fusca TaxID=39272 RepID=A0A8J2M5I1_9HEXA|nr:unnamed protein product [Allacma fusca]